MVDFSIYKCFGTSPAQSDWILNVEIFPLT